MKQLPPHPRYDVQQSIETADAVAYAFLDRVSDPVQYPFKYREVANDDVRVRITYSSLCHSDCLHTRALWNPELEHPDCPGHEICGRVEVIGKDVKNFKIGDRVGVTPQRYYCGECDLCQRGIVNLCVKACDLYDQRYFGGYCTHVQLPERMVFHLPEGFDESRGAPILCAGQTVFAPLKRFYAPNKKCAVIGIGGLGHLAVMIAAKLGMEVTAFTTSNQREEEFKRMGASGISHSTNLESLEKEKGKYDIVLNTLYIEDENVFKSHQRLTACNGTYIQVGAPAYFVNFRLDHAYIILNQITVHGSVVASYKEIEDCLRFCAEHEVYPIIENYEFEEFPKAFAKLEKGRPHYRGVVNVGKWAQEKGLWK